MDPDNTSATASFNVEQIPAVPEVVSHGNVNDGVDFFSELLHFKDDTLAVENMKATYELVHGLFNFQTGGIQNEVSNISNSLEINRISTQDQNEASKKETEIKELSAKIEGLSQLNKELEEKNSQQESQLYEYEEKLAEKMSDLLSLTTETETLRRSFEASEGERIALIEKVQQLQAELTQFKELKLRNVNDDEQIVSLQKDLSIKTKAERKLKKEIDTCHEQLTVKSKCLNQLKKSNKKFANLLLNFGEKMEKAKLLTLKEKKFLHALSKDCQDQNSDFSLSLAAINL
ncbi:centromere-associated protein E-like isoform X1 [Stegodyphus dumicola]|uniref:centromere-associated protein E-like isoform X1 n=1 Tax=Stegodyphus dumicola TaxID=202533 RepID=UPI0015B2D165|nr:centromere-associated protein E-like isoform X1 [Stegodyphus dumicola]